LHLREPEIIYTKNRKRWRKKLLSYGNGIS
jgi:hypothetical protein